MKTPRASYAIVLSIAIAAFGLAGCCSDKHSYARPGFAGVPEAVNRSRDYELPLKPGDRKDLVRFIASQGSRAAVDDDQVQPGDEKKAEGLYGAVLDRLQQGAPCAADLREASSFFRQFKQDDGVLVIHDARAGWENGWYQDLGTDTIRGLVKGDFVFAFYLRRFLPLACGGTEDQPAGWTLGPPGAGSPIPYTGLVVFQRGFAIPTKAH